LLPKSPHYADVTSPINPMIIIFDFGQAGRSTAAYNLLIGDSIGVLNCGVGND
jgi:hypothetical protein